MRILVALLQRLTVCALVGIFANIAAGQSYTDKVATTPTIIQDTFGPTGDQLPFGGQEYCCPAAVAMSLEYLGINGFNQLAPANPTSADSLNLVRVLSGLMSTDQINGTFTNNLQTGVSNYLQAQGISTSNFTLSLINSPTMDQLTALNQSGAVVQTLFGFYYQNNNTYSRGGGHCVALLNQNVDSLGNADPNNIVVANPLPGALLNLPDVASNSLQNIGLIPTTPDLAAYGALMQNVQFSPARVLEQAVGLSIDPSQLSANNPTPQTWTLTSTPVLNPNGGTLPVLAPITSSGSFGININSAGTVEMKNIDTASGLDTVTGGTWRSDISSGSPFGTGTIQMSAAKLQIVAQNGTGAASMSAANEAGSQFSFSFQSTIALDRQQNSSLALQLGGNTDGSTPNLVRGANGTLIIAPADGTASLGTAEQLTVAGTGSNLPALTNGIVAPYIVGQDNDANSSGDFLTYGPTGFAKALYIDSAIVPITASTNATIYNASTSQNIPAATTAAAYAIRVNSVTIGGGAGSTLAVGATGAGRAGIILNGGAINATTLAFGSNEGDIYTSAAGGTINSTITGSGAVTVFGLGALTLTAANSYTGQTHINGTLIAANTTGSATGNGSVTVAQNGELEVNANATAGSAFGTTIRQGGTLFMNGGTLTGIVSASGGSFLLGKGNIPGSAIINGANIGGSSVDFGAPAYNGVENLTFGGSDSVTSAIYDWKLNGLDDSPTDAGSTFSTLNFTAASGVNLGTSTHPIYVTLDLAGGLDDPNSVDAFWNQPHQWDIANDPNGFANLWYTYDFPTYADGAFSVSNDVAMDKLYLDYAPVPEPSAATLLAIAAALTIRRRRRTPC